MTRVRAPAVRTDTDGWTNNEHLDSRDDIHSVGPFGGPLHAGRPSAGGLCFWYHLEPALSSPTTRYFEARHRWLIVECPPLLLPLPSSSVFCSMTLKGVPRKYISRREDDHYAALDASQRVPSRHDISPALE